MTFRSVIQRNIFHFWQTNLAVILGVSIAVSVLAGALLVGSSVRASLRSLALERLGTVDTVITSPGFFQESLAGRLTESLPLKESFEEVIPIIAIEGFVTHQASGRRSSSVQIYGVDDRFWSFHGLSKLLETPGRNRVLVSQGLAQELGTEIDDALLVRVERPSAVPISSLHGRREDVGRTLRVSVATILPSERLGEFSFRPQQGLSRAVFVSMERLQRELDQPGRANTILLRAIGAQNMNEMTAAKRLTAVEAAVREFAALEDIGLRVVGLPDLNALSIESEAGLINENTASAVSAVAASYGLVEQPIMTYLANQLQFKDRAVPYSLVTAINLSDVSAEDFGDLPENVSPVIINNWVAEDLEVRRGDRIGIEYYVWEDEGRLTTQETTVQVVAVVPMKGLASDQRLAPDFPGITEADDVTEWDPPFEIDLGLIRPKDEAYWDDYRTTPKAFIPLETGQQLWGSRWGQLTGIRLLSGQNKFLPDPRQFASQLLTELNPLVMGFVVYPARALALEASSGVTDFGLYFIYFSFFLVVSALLLASLFFRLGIEQRLKEIGLLKATGFSQFDIGKLFRTEAFVLSFIGSLMGVGGAVLYGKFVMFGLSTWWVDAVGTTRLVLHLSPFELAVGAVGGVLAALGTIAWTLRSISPASPRSLLSGSLADVSLVPKQNDVAYSRWYPSSGALSLALFLLGLLFIVLAFVDLLDQTVGFFSGGLCLLCAMLTFSWMWLTVRPQRHTNGPWSVSQLGFRNLAYRPGRSVLCIALIASAAFIIVAVDAFRRDGGTSVLDRRSGTGGYTLLADTLLPIAQDLSVADGREALNIADLYEASGPLEEVTLSRFKLRPGEDASCLNLYQAKDPRILAPTESFMHEGRFVFGKTIEKTENPWLLLNLKFEDGAIPAIADKTSLAYALHLKVGDDFVLNRDTDNPLRLRIVAELSDSIFQRELMISESNFDKVFPDYDGYRFFLIDAAPNQMAEVSAAFEDRLADYGFDVMSTAEQLAAFHRVENTYLSTFQTLGALGLILGTFGLGTVLLRNVLERRRELGLLRAVGFNGGYLALLVMSENAFLLLAGVFVGTFSAVVAIAPVLIERGGGLPLLSLAILLLVVVASGLMASVAATITALRSPLLPALRSE